MKIKKIKSFVILASQFSSLINAVNRLRNNKVIPFDNPEFPPVIIKSCNNHRSIVICSADGSNTATSGIPSRYDPPGAHEHIRCDIFSDQTIQIRKMRKRENPYDAVRTEIAKTTIPQDLFVETHEPFSLFDDEKMKAHGEPQLKFVPTREKKMWHGGEFIFIYTKVNEKIRVTQIIGRPNKQGIYTDAALDWFEDRIKDFYRKPTNAFDHILKPKPHVTMMSEKIFEDEFDNRPTASAPKTPAKVKTPDRKPVKQFTKTPAKAKNNVPTCNSLAKLQDVLTTARSTSAA